MVRPARLPMRRGPTRARRGALRERAHDTLPKVIEEEGLNEVDVGQQQHRRRRVEREAEREDVACAAQIDLHQLVDEEEEEDTEREPAEGVVGRGWQREQRDFVAHEGEDGGEGLAHLSRAGGGLSAA